MQLNWLLIWESVMKRHQEKHHPLADPLERPEWQRNEWMIRTLCWLVRPRASGPRS